MKKKQNVETKVVKKTKLKYKNVLFFLLFLLVISVFAIYLIKLPIKNIYISGNNILSDQEIINIAGLSNYPSTLTNTSFTIKNKLEKDNMIVSAKVTKKQLSKVYIEVTENRPLFYDSNTSKIIYSDGTSKDGEEQTPYLVNYVPDTIYDKFKTSMTNINDDVIKRISEIEYQPNEVDKERFYLTMNDGNYVYLTLTYFDKVNNYISMIKQFKNKKGILYLDSGEYFEIR